MTNVHDILWEGKFYWVLRSHPFRGKPVTQVMKTGSVVSESVETYKPGADGESIAIARAKYLENRAQEKYERDRQEFRLERPAMFAYRVVAYLSKYGSQQCWPQPLVELAKEAQRAR